MSTLKKILALTMAIAMVLSLNVFAAFKDQDKINEDCVDAMELMDALGIIKGDNGNAKPEANITRAEAATMIFRLMNKGNDSASIYNGGKYFTDVATGSWYEGYVNYGYTMNIIQGRTATTFDPQAPVTGLEIAKMLLTCLNYSSATEGYTGANWAKNVQNDAFAAGLLEDYGMALTVPAQRQWVAVMFMNALNAYMVKYPDGELTEQEYTLGEKKFDYTTVTGVVTAIGTSAIDTNGGTSKYTTVKTGTKSVDGGTVGVYQQFKKLAADVALGQTVKVYYKSATSVYAIMPTADNTVGTSTVFDTEKSSGDQSVDTKYTVGDLTGKLDTDVIFAINNPDCRFDVLTGTNAATALYNKVGKNSMAKVTAIDNDDDGKIEVVIAISSLYNEIDISSKGVVKFPATNPIKTVAADDVEDNINYVDTVKDGDFVKVTANPFTKMYDVEAVETVSGTVTRIYSAAKYAIDGTNYYASIDSNPSVSALGMANDVTLYVDGKIFVMAELDEGTKSTVLPENIGMVLYAKLNPGKLGSAGYWEVVLLKQDGTTATYEVDSDSDDIAESLTARNTKQEASSVSSEGVLVDLVKYSVNKDGTLTIAWPAADAGVKDAVKVNYTSNVTLNYKTDAFVFANGDTYRVASDAKIFVGYVKSGYVAFKVMNIADFTKNQENATVGFYYTMNSGIPTVVGAAMYIGGSVATGTVKGSYVYALSNNYSVYDKTEEETRYYVDVVDENGKEATLELENSSKTAASGTVYTYVTDSDGIATLTGATETTYAVSGKVKFSGLSGNLAVFGGATVTLADDVKVLMLNDDDDLVAGTIADIFVNTTESADQAEVIYVVDKTAGNDTLNQVIMVIEK